MYLLTEGGPDGKYLAGPDRKSNLRKFSVSFQGPTYYDSIENDIKESYSLHLFKTKLKKKLYMNY